MVRNSITVDGNEYTEPSSRSVGQAYKDPKACNIYKPHSLDVKLHAIFQELLRKDFIEEVFARGNSCGSHPNDIRYVSYTNQHNKHLTNITLHYNHNNNAQEIENKILELANKIDVEVDTEEDWMKLSA